MGHYGNGHRGIAVEFDAQQVAESVVDHNALLNPSVIWPPDQKVWTPVLYRDKIDRLTPEDFYDFMKAPMDDHLNTKLAFYFNCVSRTKSTVWHPEHEWRLMWRNDEIDPPSVYKVPISPRCIHRVYIGLRVADDLATQIVTAARLAFPDVAILRARARPGEFALDFQAV